MSQPTTLNLQTAVGTSLGALVGAAATFTKTVTVQMGFNDPTTGAIVLTIVCAIVGFVTTELCKVIKDKLTNKPK